MANGLPPKILRKWKTYPVVEYETILTRKGIHGSSALLGQMSLGGQDGRHHLILSLQFSHFLLIRCGGTWLAIEAF